MRVVWPVRVPMLWWYVFIDILSGVPHDKRLMVVVCEDDNELVARMMMMCGTTGIRMKPNGTGLKVKHQQHVNPQE